MSIVHKIISLFKIVFMYVFFYEKFLVYKNNIHIRSYINQNDLPSTYSEGCLITFTFDFTKFKFSQVNTDEFYNKNENIKTKFKPMQFELTINYNEKVTPHHLSPILNKIYSNSYCNHNKIIVYLVYDLIISILAVISYFFKLYSLPSKILLFDSILKITSLLYLEFHIDRATEQEYIKNFRRFFKLYIPTILSNDFKEFIKSARNIFFSDEFFRVSLNILCLVSIIFINIFSLVFGEFQEKNVENNCSIKMENLQDKSITNKGHSKKD